MPVLENPEVISSVMASGLASFRQPVNADVAKAEYETDVGINDPAGLNVLCNSIQLYHPPVTGDQSQAIKMSLYLGEEWAQKDDFIARLKQDHAVKVTEETLPWGNPQTVFTVTGQQNIQKFGKLLRESFAETSHQGATIQRQIVNAALLGTAIDHMNAVVAKSQEPRESRGVTWATYDWNA